MQLLSHTDCVKTLQINRHGGAIGLCIDRSSGKSRIVCKYVMKITIKLAAWRLIIIRVSVHFIVSTSDILSQTFRISKCPAMDVRGQLDVADVIFIFTEICFPGLNWGSNFRPSVWKGVCKNETKIKQNSSYTICKKHQENV